MRKKSINMLCDVAQTVTDLEDKSRVARDGSDWYAALELAVAEAHLGNRPAALASARRAGRLNPRAAVARAALSDLLLGRIPSQPALDRALAAAAT